MTSRTFSIVFGAILASLLLVPPGLASSANGAATRSSAVAEAPVVTNPALARALAQGDDEDASSEDDQGAATEAEEAAVDDEAAPADEAAHADESSDASDVSDAMPSEQPEAPAGSDTPAVSPPAAPTLPQPAPPIQAPAPPAQPLPAPPLPARTAPTCTQFIGYSQTDQWFSTLESVLGSDRYQLLQNSGGAMIRWADPGYSGWRNALQSACARNASTPDRAVLDITHYDYLTPAATNGDPVGFMERIVRNAVATTHSRYPSVRQIVLQPVVGGPGATACPWRGAQEGSVRASYNHAAIYQAAGRVAGGDVILGPDTAVRTCADYADDQGHLVDGARAPIGRTIAQYYQQQG